MNETLDYLKLETLCDYMNNELLPLMHDELQKVAPHSRAIAKIQHRKVVIVIEEDTNNPSPKFDLADLFKKVKERSSTVYIRNHAI